MNWRNCPCGLCQDARALASDWGTVIKRPEETWFQDEVTELRRETLMRKQRRANIRFFAGLILTVLGLIFAAAMMSLMMGGCAGPAKTITVEKVVPVVTVKRCADKAPPAFARVPRPTTCATGMLCFPIPDAATLAENVERLKEWVLTTWSLCAPTVPQ